MTSRRARRISLLTAALLLAALLVPRTSEAQYFGKNKVQYKTFDFAVLRTEHFDVYHYQAERAAAVQAGRLAERWYARFARILNHELTGRQPIVLYASHPDFEQTNAVPGQIGEATGGVTEFLKRRIVLPLAGSLEETDHVLGHELVHAFQFDITGQGSSTVGSNVPAALRMPLWFVEGMAEYLSVGSRDPFTAMWLRGAVEADELPDLGDLADPRFFPYRYGHALWAYIGGRWGSDAVGRVLKATVTGRSLRRALSGALAVDPDTLIHDWHEAVRDHYAPVLEAGREPGAFGRELVSSGTGGGELNMAPALSPDGRQIVFASEKNRFSVELFVADVRTGEVQRKLTETALDPHFQSLQYLSSSGAWSPEGRRFAVAAVSRGEPVLVVLDPRSGEKLREIRVPAVGQIHNPTWGPEGRRVAFSARVGGFTDLYVLDLETGDLRRLTEDPWAEIHPAWSPDGRRMAFATDRFTADGETLRPGGWRLAVLDPETGEITPVDGPRQGRQINPQWSPDGGSLYFVSDHGGVPNLYRLDRTAGELRQVTDLKTGVSGLTPLSPAVSVARDRGSAVFSVHGKGKFVLDLYVTESRETLAGRRPGALEEGATGPDPGALPPVARGPTRLDELLADARVGLPDSVTFETTDYEPSLSLDYVGRPNVAVGADRFGFFAGGGGSLFFSDMLGHRSLAALVQVDGSTGRVLESTALFGSYSNRKARWNWGVLGGQIPLITRRFTLRRDSLSDGGEGLVFRDFRFWQVNRELTGRVEYPFNEAHRAEFSAGAGNTDFAAQLRETEVGSRGEIRAEREIDCGELDPSRVQDQEKRICAEVANVQSVNTVHASAALVFDNAIFGATGPVLGQRYRLEVQPTLGSVDYYTVLSDVRRYEMPIRPLTVAGRILHFGRYGGDAEDPRLRRFFLGFPTLVRGYEAGSFRFDECLTTATAQACPVFDRLLGSRLAVLNAELRLPLIGRLGLLRVRGIPPLDLVTFFDAGAAWTKASTPTLLGGDREVVRSVGVGARLNLFGLLVLEADYLNPLDRENTGWFWDLSVIPGF